jgi:DHA1 family bicyclomycin/chloramphenicol resistance-like MFS transporter
MAPVIGGFINAAIGWRGNYAVVAAICVISWVILFFYLDETKTSKKSFKISKMIEDYKTLVSSAFFLVAASLPSFSYGCYLSFVALAPFIYMDHFGLSLFAYTLHQASILVVFSLFSAFSGKITHILSEKRTIFLALGVGLIGSTLMLSANSSYLLTISMCIHGAGAALFYPIIFARSIEIFPELKGTSSSFIMSLRYLICASITGLAGFLYNGTSYSLSLIIFIIMFLTILLTMWKLQRLI